MRTVTTFGKCKVTEVFQGDPHFNSDVIKNFYGNGGGAERVKESKTHDAIPIVRARDSASEPVLY